jgi:hypothetical protein
MKRRILFMNIFLFIAAAGGLIEYMENVRAVQIVGLFASGMLFGVALSRILLTAKKKL